MRIKMRANPNKYANSETFHMSQWSAMERVKVKKFEPDKRRKNILGMHLARIKQHGVATKISNEMDTNNAEVDMTQML